MTQVGIIKPKPNALDRIFHLTKPIIAVIHHPPLPGSPCYEGEDVQEAYAVAARDAETLARGGVVFSMRCPSGSVRVGYRIPGGRSPWWEAGAVFSGHLGGLNHRVVLALGLRDSFDRAQLVQLFTHFGGGGRP